MVQIRPSLVTRRQRGFGFADLPATGPDLQSFPMPMVSIEGPGFTGLG